MRAVDLRIKTICWCSWLSQRRLVYDFMTLAEDFSIFILLLCFAYRCGFQKQLSYTIIHSYFMHSYSHFVRDCSVLAYLVVCYLSYLVVIVGIACCPSTLMCPRLGTRSTVRVLDVPSRVLNKLIEQLNLPKISNTILTRLSGSIFRTRHVGTDSQLASCLF